MPFNASTSTTLGITHRSILSVVALPETVVVRLSTIRPPCAPELSSRRFISVREVPAKLSLPVLESMLKELASVPARV